MLDRHSQLAVPDESYFIPQVAARHRGAIDVEAFCDDISRIRTLADWGLPVDDVRAALPAAATVSDGIDAIFSVHAARHGKTRWGDKTPMYMQYLPLIDGLFPHARYVHIVRDGRDAAASFLAMPAGVATATWAHPRSPAEFACQWSTEVQAARALGANAGADRYLEVRYEQLVADPPWELSAICRFAGLEYEPGMVDYASHLDLSGKPHLTRLAQPPTQGVRNWRDDMAPAAVAEFEAVAGDVLASCGYELADPDRSSGPGPRERATLVSYRARSAAWRATARAIARSPLWRRRHPRLQAPA
jgi:hypothetical protein